MKKGKRKEGKHPDPAGLPLLLDRLRRALPAGVDGESDPPHLRCAASGPAEVAAVLQSAVLAGVRVSLEGAPEALLHLSLDGLDSILSIDEAALVCEVQAGVTLQALDARLRKVGLTVGPLPLPSLCRTVGAVLSAPRPCEASPQLGRLRDRALRVYGVVPGLAQDEVHEVALPVALSPRRASGPDLKQVLLGTRGKIGVITSCSLGLCRLPAQSALLGWMFPSPAPALSALSRLLGAGVVPGDAQVVDRAWLAPLWAGALPLGEAALVLRCDGVPGVVEAQARRCREVCADLGGHELPEAASLACLSAPSLPEHQRALPSLSPDELAAAFAAASGPVVLCGVHAHGAALCSGGPAQAPLVVPPLTQALLAPLASVLC